MIQENRLAYLQGVLNAFEDLIFVIDENAIFRDYMSSDTSKLVQPKDTFLGKPVEEVLPSSICLQIHDAIKALITDSVPYAQFDYSLSNRWYLANITRIQESGVQTNHFLAVIRDITEVKQKQALIEDLYKNANQGILWFSALPDRTIGTDTPYQFHLVTCNEEGKRLLRLSSASDHKSSLAKAINPLIEELKYQFLQVMQKGLPISESRNLSSNLDEPHWVSLHFSKQGDGILLNIRDITDQVLLNEELHARNTRLHELNQKKDEVLSVISHDLRSPLAGILSLLSLLQEDHTAVTEEQKSKFLGLLDENAKKMLGMLDDLLSWGNSSIRNSNQQELSQINWHAELEWVIYSISGFESKKITIVNSIDHGIITRMNKGMARSILRNLLSNALKFSYPNAEIIVTASIENDFIHLSVQDFGVGMDSEQLNSLLHNETPQSTAGTQGEKGTGMGVEIIKRFLERNFGYLKIKSEQGKGSTFIVSMPIKSN